MFSRIVTMIGYIDIEVYLPDPAFILVYYWLRRCNIFA